MWRARKTCTRTSHETVKQLDGIAVQCGAASAGGGVVDKGVNEGGRTCTLTCVVPPGAGAGA